MLIPLREIFPGVSADCMTILNAVNGNGGNINAGDVVSCIVDGTMHVGELVLCVGVRRADAFYSYCVVSLWQPHPESDDVVWPTYTVCREDCKCSLWRILTQFSHTGCRWIDLFALFTCPWRFDQSKFHPALTKTIASNMLCMCSHVHYIFSQSPRQVDQCWLAFLTVSYVCMHACMCTGCFACKCYASPGA